MTVGGPSYGSTIVSTDFVFWLSVSSGHRKLSRLGSLAKTGYIRQIRLEFVKWVPKRPLLP